MTPRYEKFNEFFRSNDLDFYKKKAGKGKRGSKQVATEPTSPEFKQKTVDDAKIFFLGESTRTKT